MKTTIRVDLEMRRNAEAFIKEYAESWDVVSTEETGVETWEKLRASEQRLMLGAGAKDLATHSPSMAELVSFAEAIAITINLPRKTERDRMVALGAIIQRVAYAQLVHEADEPRVTHATTGTVQ